MPHCTLAPCACGRPIRIKVQESDIVGSGGIQLAIYLLAQTLSKCGRRCLFQRPTAAQWSQSWQRRAPEDRVVSIRSGTTGIIFRFWWSTKKSNPLFLPGSCLDSECPGLWGSILWCRSPFDEPRTHQLFRR